MARPKRTEEDERLVRYLLGQLPVEQRAAIEQRYLGETALVERLEAIESDLIEQYLDRELTGEEKLAFEEQYLANPERRRKVEWTAALVHRLRKGRRGEFRAAWQYGLIAAMLFVTISVSALYFGSRPPEPVQLHPGGNSRSIGAGVQQIAVAHGDPVLRLRLDLGGADFARINRANLRTVEDENPVWSEKLPRGTSTFRDIAIQSSILENRDYILSLESASETLVSYSFRVEKR